MELTLDQASETIQRAKANVERDCARLLHLLTFVPDDKLTWTPTESARSAMHIVAHCAIVNQNFARLITDTMPEVMPTPQEFFAEMREGETTVKTREELISLVTESESQVQSALDTVDSNRINGNSNGPFGPMPIKFWVDLTHDHLCSHNGQLEYVQTLWGDLDLHLA